MGFVLFIIAVAVLIVGLCLKGSFSFESGFGFSVEVKVTGAEGAIMAIAAVAVVIIGFFGVIT